MNPKCTDSKNYWHDLVEEQLSEEVTIISFNHVKESLDSTHSKSKIEEQFLENNEESAEA